jgi:hypothetical protein
MWRSLMICTALAVTGCATTPATHNATAPPSANNTCVPVGSRIPSNNNCPPGQSYTQQQIQQTGQYDVGTALQMLDPAVTRP